MHSPFPLAKEEIAEHLSAVAGPDFVHFDGVRVTVDPGNAEDVAAILRFANANGLTVTPMGGGTKSAWGNSVAADIVLSLVRLNRLREHAWQDLTCAVEAGCTWSDLQLALMSHRQMVAIDPAWPDRATIGGIVATNDSGALRLKYGSLRDLIIGMTIVLADGTIAKSGGKVVKNVAGYDLHKLMIGGFGTLGVITEVNFRLHPTEERRRSWTVRAIDPMMFHEGLAALLDSQSVPSSIQIRTNGQRFALDACVAALPETIRDFGDQLQQVFRNLEIADSSEEVWLEREELFNRSENLILKISVLSSQICSSISQVMKSAAEAEMEIAIVAQATGLIMIRLSSSPESGISFVDHLREQVEGAGGSVVALQVPEMLRERLDMWGALPCSIGLMREIKHRFDPKLILNPGRFVGSI